MFVAFAAFSVVTAARAEDEKTSVIKELSGAVEEIISSLDLENLSREYSSIESFSEADVSERIRSYLTGKVDFKLEDLFSSALSVVLGSVSSFLPFIGAVIAVAILSAILRSVSVSSSLGAEKAAHFALSAAVIALSSSAFFSVMNAAREAVNGLNGQMQAVFPVVLTLMTASGASVSASVFQPSVSYICALEGMLCGSILFPVAVLLFLFGAVNCVLQNVSLVKTRDFFKSIFKWITGCVTLVFCFFISAQGIASSSFDGFSVKALKYVVGNGVPLVGQMFNGGFDVVFASCVLVKNSLGLIAMAGIILTIVAPVAQIGVLTLLFRFLSAVTEPVADERIVKFLSSSADSLGYLAATVISVAIVYMILVFIVICSLGIGV